MDPPSPPVAWLEALVNSLLRADPASLERLAAMDGQLILLEVLGPGLKLYCAPGPDGLSMSLDAGREPDCALRGTPLGFARLGLGERPAEGLFQGAVEMRGDPEVGERFRAVLADLDLDWEEQLSKVAGDPLAHQIGQGVRAWSAWGSRAHQTLAENLKEYLQEEARLLPTPWEVEEFAAAVDILRDDAERLAARIERLVKRRNAP